MSKSVSIYTFMLAGFLTFALFASYQSPEVTKEEKRMTSTSSTSQLPQQIKAIDLDRTFDFSGEALPMENFDVRERLEREILRNSYYHSNTLLLLKRANRYFPVIERILAENGLPDDLKYLAVTESDLTMAVSPSGAKGIWQFMKGTGQQYGLEVNSGIDERYHVEKSTQAACKYLKKLKKRFGSWSLAAAAYNMGGNKLSSEMKAQRANSYYDLNLNQETMRYFFRIVAIKEIMTHPEEFGFYLQDEEKYPELEFVNMRVEKTIENLGDFAQQNGITYRTLKIYNPWLIGSRLPNKSGRTYFVKVPKK